jgi:5-methylcytosine-specific restriction endonuclease McrA
MTYYQNNKDRIKKEARKCRDNREIRKILLKKQNGRCAKCGTTKNLSIDHIMPVSKCGANTIDNLQILCRSCNSKKSYKVE